MDPLNDIPPDLMPTQEAKDQGAELIRAAAEHGFVTDDPYLALQEVMRHIALAYRNYGIRDAADAMDRAGEIAATYVAHPESAAHLPPKTRALLDQMVLVTVARPLELARADAGPVGGSSVRRNGRRSLAPRSGSAKRRERSRSAARKSAGEQGSGPKRKRRVSRK
jgi:hypothetical protein